MKEKERRNNNRLKQPTERENNNLLKRERERGKKRTF